MSAPRAYTQAIICDTTLASTPGVSGLVQVATGVLPDGAQAFVLSNRTLYRLNKTLSVPAPGDSLGGLLGGLNGGVWVPVPGGSAIPATSAAVRTNADKAINLTGISSFFNLPSSAATFVAAALGSSFTLDTAAGQLVYHGADDQLVMLVANATMYNGTTVIDTIMGVSLNSDAPLAQPQSEITSPVAAGASSFYQMTIAGVLQLDDGDTIDLVFAGDSSTLTITKLSYSLLAL